MMDNKYELSGVPPVQPMPRQLQVRLAGIDDVEALAQLFDAYRQFYEQAPDLETARNFIRARLQRQDAVLLLAQDGTDSIGFCQLYPSFCSILAQPVYVLYDLFVRPQTRRSGAGRALLRAAHAHAAAHGYARLDLTTAKTNLQAQALYVSEGYVLDEVFFAYAKMVC